MRARERLEDAACGFEEQDHRLRNAGGLQQQVRKKILPNTSSSDPALLTPWF